MQYRGFIQFALLLLASGCLIFGLIATMATLIVCVIAIECIVWTRVLEQVEDCQAQSGAI